MAFSAEMTPEKARLYPLACSGPASLSFHSLICGRMCAPPSSQSQESSTARLPQVVLVMHPKAETGHSLRIMTFRGGTASGYSGQDERLAVL